MFSCLKGFITEGRVFESGGRHFQVLIPSRLNFKSWNKEIYAHFRIIGKNYLLENFIEA